MAGFTEVEKDAISLSATDFYNSVKLYILI